MRSFVFVFCCASFSFLASLSPLHAQVFSSSDDPNLFQSRAAQGDRALNAQVGSPGHDCDGCLVNMTPTTGYSAGTLIRPAQPTTAAPEETEATR
jgi:hypothetical protein